MKKKLAILMATTMMISSFSPVYGAEVTVESTEVEDVLLDGSSEEVALEEDDLSMDEIVTENVELNTDQDCEPLEMTLKEEKTKQAGFENAQLILENKKITVEFRDAQNCEATFYFVPKKDGKYMFENDSDTYLSVYVYNESFKEVSPGLFSYALQKGKKYYIKIAADEEMSEKICLKRKPEVTSIKLVSGPSRKVLYRGIDILRSDLVGLPGVVLKANYEDGTSKTSNVFMDGAQISVVFGKYDDMYQFKLNGVSKNTIPAEGTYSATISLENQKIKVSNIVVKDCKKLPTVISGEGSCYATINSGQRGWIQLKTGKSSKYQLSNTNGTNMFLYSINAIHSRHSGEDLSQSLAEVKSGKTVVLKPQTEYFLCVSSNYYHTEKMVQKIKVTAKPLEAINLSSCTITASSATYTGKAVSSSFAVKYGSKKLAENKDYTVSYQNNIKCGTATAIIKGKGNYKGTVKKTFQIIPAVPSSFSVKQSGKQLKLQWKRAAGAKYYEIYQYKSGTWKKVKATSSLSYTDKYVKKGVTYKYKVRAYIVVNGKKIYGKFTSSKSYTLE